MFNVVASNQCGDHKCIRNMAKLTKKQKEAFAKFDKTQLYSLEEAVKVASVTWEQVRQIAEAKMPDLNCFTVESAMSMVAGTARSMGITVKGDFPA